MAYSKLARLVQLLAGKTERDELQWEPTAQEGSFQVSFPHYSVQMGRVENYSAQAPDDVVITIRNKEGQMIEGVSDADLLSEWPEAYSIMSKMYGKARRQALGVDKALDELLGELDDDWLKK